MNIAGIFLPSVENPDLQMTSERLPKTFRTAGDPYGLDVDVVWEWVKHSECKP
jgi:hypothetical protein